MELLNIFSAIPKVALFLLVIVGGAIVAEIFYFGKKRETKPPEVSLPVLPPSGPPPPSPTDVSAETQAQMEAKAVAGPPPAPSVENLEVTPMPSPQAAFTTEVVPAKKSPLSKKTLTALLVILLVTVSIPAAILLVRQRQEIRKQAYGEPCQYDNNCPGWPNERCSGGVCVPLSANCGGNGVSCDSVGGESNCCSGVCSYGTCRGDNPGEGCGGFGESECWTHVNCNFISGSCQPRTPGTATPVVSGSVTCEARRGHVAIKNNSSQTISGDVSWFIGTCNDDVTCLCGGQSSSENVTLAPNQSWSKSGGGAGCAWQSEVSGLANCSGNGCIDCGETPPPGTTPPTTTPPIFSAQCIATGTFDTDFNAITDLTTLAVGQTVVFGTHGSTTDPGGITMARFRINGTADTSWCNGTGNTIVAGWCQTTNIHGANFFVQFTVPNNGPFNVSSMVFNPTLGWH